MSLKGRSCWDVNCSGWELIACRLRRRQSTHRRVPRAPTCLSTDCDMRLPCKRALTKSLEGGFYFHPADEDQSAGTPVGKSHLAGLLSGYSYSDSAVADEDQLHVE